MLSLRDFQAEFYASIRGDTSGEDLLAMIASGRIDPERRLNVYRNNHRISLKESLKATYPGVFELIGEGLFAVLANRYLDLHPSASGDLHQYGAFLANFLQDQDEVSALPYLADIARLEWAYHLVFHETEEAPLRLDDLAGLEPAVYASVNFVLNPASRLIYSKYPVLDIWKLANTSGDSDDQVDLDSGGCFLLVARRNLVMEFQKLDASEFRFLELVATQTPLTGIVDEITREFPEFDLQACLQAQFAKGNLTGFHLKED